jgi:hypothetical protein
MSTTKPTNRVLARIALQALRECQALTATEEREFVAAILARLKASRL